MFLLLLGIALSLPFVQTWIAHYATDKVNKDFGTHIQIDKIAISVFGGVKLKGVLILDHHNDTLIAADRLQTNIINARGFLDSKLRFGTIKAHKLNFHMKTYKGEKTSNLDVFVKSFDSGKPGTGKFRLRTDDLYVTDGRFRLTNENAVTARVLDLKKLNGQLKDFYIKGSDVTADIQKLSLLDHRGLFVDNLKAKFSYSKTNIKLDDLELKTAESALTGKVKLTYTIADMKDFVNRVKFDFTVDRASVSSNELNYFFNEFGRNQKFYLSTRLTGPLNNFVLHDLKLLDDKDSEIIGSVNFRHLFDKKGPGFYMNGNFDRVTSNYSNLKNIMPRILGKSLPTILEKFGRIDLVGDVVLTKTDITTNLYVMSELGEATADLSVKDYNKPDIATYLGTIDLEGFNVGGLLNNKMVGLATLHVDVNGQGFNKKSLNTTVKGDIASFVANKYRYKNIKVDGQFKWPYFNGRINSNDPNLRMSFDGLVDMSTNRIKYDFDAKVDYADLHILNLVKKDTLAIFKGKILAKASGNSINTLAGKLEVSELYYQNSRDSYFFEDFSVEASYDNKNVRTVTINSKDIIEGQISGIYDIKEVPKLVQNALGSLYTNYSPFKVKKGQFFDFNFTIYNKIVEIISPEIVVGENTVVKGRIDGDKGEFVLGFNSPIITAFKNEFDNINIDINNKNTLYNSYVSMDTIKLSKYKISDFRAVNITQNDTLHVRTEFKGGTGKDYFHLNLYHTIDKDNKSIVGFKKSEISLKDYMWYINEENESDNKIIFNKKLTDFSIDRIIMSHDDQQVRLGGEIRGKDFKDLKLNFNDVDLNKITPSLDSLSFGGRLNGEVNLKQDKQEFQPAASITIDSLKVNKFNIGDLALQVTGDRSFRKFTINTSIARNDEENFYANGAIEVVDKQTLMSVDAVFTDFDISPLQMFLKSIFPEIRGRASGRAAIVGNVKNPEINGVLYLKKAGLKVGYLNTDYNFAENAMVTLSDKAITFPNIELTDVKYKTKGILTGTVKHKLFRDWELDEVKITSDRILVLDTQDSDDALYYGTAFIKGEASIDGPVNNLFINVKAESKAGTDIKIPINNSGTSTNNAAFIHFLTPKEKENRLKGIVDIDKTKTFKGLELKFDLDITPEAKIEVIIDKNTGHSLSASGFGTMLLEINTLGKFNMIGDFMVQKGIYNFKYAGLIDKKITVKPNGTINWEGDPKRARLNLEAVYSLRANPSVLLEASSFNRNIPVDVSILLTGNLTNPEPDFAISFPGVSSVLKSDLEYKLTDITNRQTQALSLLSTGSFVNPNNMNAGTAVAGNLFERASSLVNGIFAEDDSKLNIGLNYVQAEKNPYVETNSQVGLTVSSQINDRITVNGQLGVPIGGVNESQIVGNVEVQIRLNDENSLKGRVFNRENDISFLGEGIGYTQGLGLSYSVDFDTIRELWRKIFSKTDEKESDTSDDGIPDSELSPEYIKFIEGRNKKKTNNSQKQPQRIPETD
ncbi:translocation/assembly module TamB domain-containing protein [Flavobacterium sp. DG1-102-2]|uniref:translocation/assembly module TamB domain-containing protein n=1 Tax=Flavobacterium sp. DG1-102-2 TaxID=3081663 RepID=UPI00294A6E4E|nr:translocation/assembly module TamB domain-containing protein [Flavobacterium sp. DG1-102-2]MDV6166814.1 translocation/assembly module TamB domain-containing protein [Flavobacterium sp. DG1-102-2]